MHLKQIYTKLTTAKILLHKVLHCFHIFNGIDVKPSYLKKIERIRLELLFHCRMESCCFFRVYEILMKLTFKVGFLKGRHLKLKCI